MESSKNITNELGISLRSFVNFLATIVDKDTQVNVLKVYDFNAQLGYLIEWLIIEHNILPYADTETWAFRYNDFTKCTKEQQAYYIGRKIFYIKHKESYANVIFNYRFCIIHIIDYINNPF